MRTISELRRIVDIYKIRRLSERWSEEELCSYFSITKKELDLILDVLV